MLRSMNNFKININPLISKPYLSKHNVKVQLETENPPKVIIFSQAIFRETWIWTRSERVTRFRSK